MSLPILHFCSDCVYSHNETCRHPEETLTDFFTAGTLAKHPVHCVGFEPRMTVNEMITELVKGIKMSLSPQPSLARPSEIRMKVPTPHQQTPGPKS